MTVFGRVASRYGNVHAGHLFKRYAYEVNDQIHISAVKHFMSTLTVTLCNVDGVFARNRRLDQGRGGGYGFNPLRNVEFAIFNIADWHSLFALL